MKKLKLGLAGHIKPKPKPKKKHKAVMVFPKSYSPTGKTIRVTVKPLKQKRVKGNTI
jgi:hypothetical protein